MYGEISHIWICKKSVVFKAQAKIKFFIPPILLKFAIEAHILADDLIATFDRWR